MLFWHFILIQVSGLPDQKLHHANVCGIPQRKKIKLHKNYYIYKIYISIFSAEDALS